MGNPSSSDSRPESDPEWDGGRDANMDTEEFEEVVAEGEPILKNKMIRNVFMSVLYVYIFIYYIYISLLSSGAKKDPMILFQPVEFKNYSDEIVLKWSCGGNKRGIDRFSGKCA